MISPQEILLRLAVATLLSALVGAERERADRAAGLRTHALVGVGSCLFMLVSAFGFADIMGTDHVELDPSRIAAQVASGVGFLGAGTIILRRDTVRGLTTAAGIWASAAIGLAVGGGLWIAAGTATAFILIVLTLVKTVEHRLFGQGRPLSLILMVDKTGIGIMSLRNEVEAIGLHVERMDIRSGSGTQDRIKIAVAGRTPARDVELLHHLRRLNGVQSIKLKAM